MVRLSVACLQVQHRDVLNNPVGVRIGHNEGMDAGVSLAESGPIGLSIGSGKQFESNMCETNVHPVGVRRKEATLCGVFNYI